MSNPPRRRYLLIPLVYVAVILALFALALFGRGFSHPVGEARLSGRYTPLPLLGKSEVRRLTLSYNGLTLELSRRQPLRLLDAEGDEAAGGLGLRAVQLHSAGADIIFEKDTRLIVAASPDGALSLSLAERGGDSGAAQVSLSVPFGLRGVARQPEGAPVLSWERRGSAFILTLPPGSRLDAAAGTISLSLGTPGGRELRLARAAGGTRSPSAPWLSAEASRVSPGDLQVALARFADGAYAAWSGPRLAAEGWKMPDGTVVYDERIAAALLAEAVTRGTYPRLRTVAADLLARELRDNPGASLALSSSAYTGNLREYARRASAAGQAEVERVRELLSRSDPSLLEAERLVPALLDHGPSALAADAAGFAESRQPAELSLAAVLGALETMLDYAALAERSESAQQACRTLIDTRILAAIRRADPGIFLQTATQNTVDTRLSLRCGSLLVRAGAEMDMELAGAVGRSLLVSALALQDEQSVLPARLVLEDGRIASREARLLPEEVYALLPVPGRPLAREIPLYGSLGPGAWIWTAASDLVVEAGAARASFTLSFPVGLPHYAVIQGVPAFQQLELHGIPWRPAPDYAQYSDGWLYDAQTKTLYLKLTGKTEKEAILLTY